MKRTLIALALSAMSAVTMAEQAKPNYTYIEGGYANVSGDADGVAVRGSFDFGTAGLYGIGSYSFVETDIGSVDVEVGEIGLGYHHSISDKADLLAEATYMNTDVQGFGDVDGYRASVGVRGFMSNNFEGTIKANYIDCDGCNGDFSGTVGAVYHLNNTWGITADVQFDDTADAYVLGMRASF